LQRGAFIVEIGSNDGFLSEQFQQRGFRVLGIDASKYMARLARRRNVETVVALFGKEVAIEIRRKYGNADLIVANNVFNHANAPVDFAEGVARLLSDGGHFVFEQPYWLTTVRSKKIDQIYHEHVTYFTVKSARRLLRAANMCIVEAEVVNYHGGSLRVYARKVVNLPRERKGTTEMIRIEERARLFDELNYRELMAEILRLRNAFLKKIYGLKEKGVPIIAVGAPAKGNTFLNFYRLDRTVVNYVTDTSPHKQGKYTPLTRIPIVADSVFAQFKNPYALVLSWNIIDSIRPKLKRINAAIKYISPEQHQG
jgi:2-polyprenyl-3-methyl-5-hydroxy-6-metoxy-1,4-benzoquinol methylase